jgi:hypothetical protein
MTGSVGRRSPLVALLSANITSQTVRTTDPVMVRLLADEETGQPVRIPLVEGQSARGLRTAISRAAGNRGMSVETVAGKGFVGMKKVDQPRHRQRGSNRRLAPVRDGRGERASTTDSRWRSSCRRQTISASSLSRSSSRSAHLIPNTPSSPVSERPDSRKEATSAGPSRSDNVAIGCARRLRAGRYEKVSPEPTLASPRDFSA